MPKCNLPVVFIVSEAWLLTLRQEHSAEVVLNRAVRKMFGLKRGEVTAD
jgi:hypothetical protein